jgi:Na+-translocating ferredoxin:NAD+ oxidoreductase RnfG subunit
VIGKFYDAELFYKEMIPVSEADNAGTVSEFGDENLFKIMRAEEFLGYGYIGNAPSKTATFDYLVLFDKDFIITKSKVLIYREDYGGEIGSKRWLRQFTGKATTSPELKYNVDIIPISGATISVQSMTRAVNELLQSLATLQERKTI